MQSEWESIVFFVGHWGFLPRLSVRGVEDDRGWEVLKGKASLQSSGSCDHPNSG